MWQDVEITFPGEPFTPNNEDVNNLEDNEDVNVAVLDTESKQILGATGAFGYVCQSCSYETFRCPEICDACNNDGNYLVNTFGPLSNK